MCETLKVYRARAFMVILVKLSETFEAYKTPSKLALCETKIHF